MIVGAAILVSAVLLIAGCGGIQLTSSEGRAR